MNALKTTKSKDPRTSSAGPSRDRIWFMFDRIAGRYDLLNHLLSFGMDLRWRKKMIRFLPDGKNLSLLDLATGTGDQLISIISNSSKIRQALGMDMSVKMLEIAEKKIKKRGLYSLIKLTTGNADKIDFADNSFDVITISFGIRNFDNLEVSFNEIRRVLKPAGRLLILEFSLPWNKIMRGFHLLYLRKILPLVGSWISGDNLAYRYLNETIETFPAGESFCTLLAQNGFKNIRATPLTSGIVTIYQGEK